MRRGSIHGMIAQQHNAYKLTALQLNENDIEKACLEVLKVRGYFAVRIHSGTFRSADCKRWIKGADKKHARLRRGSCALSRFSTRNQAPGREAHHHSKVSSFRNSTRVSTRVHQSRLRKRAEPLDRSSREDS